MAHARLRIAALSIVLGSIAGYGLVPLPTAEAKPSIKDVQAKVETLYHKAEQAQERYNQAHVELASLTKDLSGLKADQAKQATVLEQARQRVENSVVQQYEGQGLSAVGQVVVSDDPAAFLSQLTTMSAYNDLQGELFSQYATQAAALQIRTDATTARTDQIAKLEKQASADYTQVHDAYQKAKALLDHLKAEERAKLAAASASTAAPSISYSNVPASGRAAAAVRFALAQVGKAYVYGASGPSAYDCSGLTMRAWGVAGVGLPHSAAAQYGSGPHIAASALQPGDLVFYYSPISHVGMYIGNGMIVNAENPSSGVRVTGLYSMPYVGAVRPG